MYTRRTEPQTGSTYLLCFYTALNLIPVTQMRLVHRIFEISYFSGSPDGVFKDKILGINGQFPGPSIEAEIGDDLEVVVVNMIQDGQNTSIHWHGMHQKDYHFEDGTSMISQCPLPYGMVQTYRFKLHQAGTYWYIVPQNHSTL
jgi:FtsP/CotA-like multicopper oxidase with cupredoxin domain